MCGCGAVRLWRGDDVLIISPSNPRKLVKGFVRKEDEDSK